MENTKKIILKGSSSTKKIREGKISTASCVKSSDDIFHEKYYTVYGYSCRSLFYTTMDFFKKDDLVIVTTPIHHTSFRNIIEKFVKPENIHIINYIVFSKRLCRIRCSSWYLSWRSI